MPNRTTRTLVVERRRLSADVGVVFVALAGTHRYREWWPAAWDTRALSPHGGVGGRWAFNGPVGRQVAEIVEAVPGRLVEFRIVDGPMRGTGRWGLAGLREETDLTLALELEAVTPLQRLMGQVRDPTRLQQRAARLLIDSLARRVGAVPVVLTQSPSIPIVV
ncbi:MAG: hypothetical protein SF002_06795 [Alphaproteobacteria bacterium]|nr:hypothetical protein [Alphaproteobacteria bacterium]